MDSEKHLAAKLFISLATTFLEATYPPLGESFEEWFFWQVPAIEHYRSARYGVAKVEVPTASPQFDLILWQSLLEHPDFVLEHQGIRLGVECKSLAASSRFVDTGDGLPCRTTIDFNSTVPCGQENYKGKYKPFASLRGQPITVFYALGLYGRIESENRLMAFLLVDGNYINRDYALHQQHRNLSRGGFGSYGDGRVRERKMYIFPNPLTDQDLLGRVALITEESDLASTHRELTLVTIKYRLTPIGDEFPFFVYSLQN